LLLCGRVVRDCDSGSARSRFLVLLLAALIPVSAARAEPLDAELGPARSAGISPDGSRVFLRPILDVTKESLPLGPLVSVPIEGGVAANLTPPGSTGKLPRVFHVVPDGSRALIEVLSPESPPSQPGNLDVWEFYSVPPEGGEFTKLDHPLGGKRIVRYRATPDGERIVYGQWSSGLGLFVTPIEGGAPIRLDVPDLGSPAYRRISISPDGSLAASVMFTLSDEEGDFNPISLFTTPLTGGPATILHELQEFGELHDLDPDEWSPSNLAFTPDGRRVVYRLTTLLYSAAVNGAPPVELAGYASGFVVTPDSSKVVYVGPRDGESGSGQSELYVVPAHGGPSLRVSHPEASGSVGRWALTSDGARVVFEQKTASGRALFSSSVQEGAPTRLSPRDATSPISLWALTPDGARVFFVQDVGAGPALFLVSVQGGDPAQLDDHGASGIVFSPNGEHLVYSTVRDGLPVLVGATVEGRHVTQLCESCAGPRWTHDGTRVVFGVEAGGKVLELRSVPIEGGIATTLTRPLGPNERISLSSIGPDSRHLVFSILRKTWAPLGPGCVLRRGGLALCPPAAPGLPGWFGRLPNWDVPILHSARLPPLVRIDVEPRHAENRVRLEGRGWISAAILGSDDVDVADVELGTLAFGPDAARPDRKVKRDDVDGDGFTDLVTRYRRDETGLAPGDARACLSGSHDGFDFESCDDLSAPGS